MPAVTIVDIQEAVFHTVPTQYDPMYKLEKITKFISPEINHCMEERGVSLKVVVYEKIWLGDLSTH